MKNTWFNSKEEAAEAGIDEKDMVTLHFRTPEEKRALELAAQHGNREQRRHRWSNGKTDGPKILTAKERNKRNARRRLAKKARKANG